VKVRFEGHNVKVEISSMQLVSLMTALSMASKQIKSDNNSLHSDIPLLEEVLSVEVEKAVAIKNNNDTF